MLFAPLAEVAEDLEAVGLLRAQLLRGPENAHLAGADAVRLARAAVALEKAAQVVQKARITYFDTHAVRNIGRVRCRDNPF